MTLLGGFLGLGSIKLYNIFFSSSLKKKEKKRKREAVLTKEVREYEQTIQSTLSSGVYGSKIKVH